MRYFTVGWEYIFRVGQSSAYWEFFAGIGPPIVGAAMVSIGAIGIVSGIFTFYRRLYCVELIRLFAVGVSLQSLFRVTVLLEAGRWGDPLLILFLCDFGAMIFLLLGLPYGRKIISCR